MTDIPISYITNKASQPATSTSTSSTSSTTGSGQLDKQGFLKLLMAQLQNQDPSSPMDTTAMMTQTTQLSMMEQLTTMADSSTQQFALQQRMAAAELVGKQVAWTNTTAGTSGSGVVSGVTYLSTGPALKVGTDSVDLADLTSVTSASTASA